MHPLRTSLLLGGALSAATLWTGVAHAGAEGGGSATGPKGQTLTVSKSSGLSADGESLKVTGKGYDPAKGIYVAFCKDNGPGKAPSPCGGGADTSGKTGGSQWVSSNPPPYGKGLAVPYLPGGTFSLTIKINAKISDAVDCAKAKCVVATRADHTRGADRSQDVRVPVEFGGGGSNLPLIGGTAIAVAVVALGGGVVVTRRRSHRTASDKVPA